MSRRGDTRGVLILAGLAACWLVGGRGPSAEAGLPPAAARSHSSLIQRLTDTVSQTLLYDTVRDLQDDDALPGWDALRSRYSDAPGLGVEWGYIRQRMEEMGLDVRDRTFQLRPTMTLTNIEGTLPGWGPGEDAVYILCAHYDSTSNDPYHIAPGSDDNASGVAGVIEAARILSQYRYRHTIRFVAFAAEEQGLVGSKQYAEAARAAGTNIAGVINLDMIGWDGDGDAVMEVYARPVSDSEALGRVLVEGIATYRIALVPRLTVGFVPAYSDQFSFWDQGYPAVLAIEDISDLNPSYHTTGDALDKLDLPYMRGIVQAAVATVAERGEIITPGVSIAQSGPDMVVPGMPVTITVCYANPGPDPAASVVITETFGPGLDYLSDNSGIPALQPASGTVVWRAGTVAPHALASFVVTASVSATLSPGDRVTNTVEVAGVAASGDPEGGRATWTGRVRYPLYVPLLRK